MFSLNEITSVCPKVETLSDEGECDGDDTRSNHSDGQTDRMSEEFPLDNKTALHRKEIEDTTAENCITVTNGSMNRHDHESVTEQRDKISVNHSSISTSSAENRALSSEKTAGQIYTMVPEAYQRCGQEGVFSARTITESKLETRNDFFQEAYANQIKSSKIPQSTRVPEGFPNNQSSIYGAVASVPMVSKRNFPSYQGFYVYNGTHRSLTPYEMGIRRKPCCNCPCHIPTSSYVLAPEVTDQRPSVIMVPADGNEVFSDASSKVDTVSERRNMLERTNIPHVQQNGIHMYEVGDTDSSDDDEDGRQEKYFRVNLDGTTARFKLTKEEWDRIPINTFPSGGRLLSGDWTRIFLSKVKESNPWCSLRFKNNHVRSENSRKIHSAVFFRGGAECKRPECNVKVRFVIRKERGKHVEVTYVGNVCHSSNPGGSDATNGRKRRQVRCGRTLSTLHG
ncbi:uncharacterized protein [Montipora foliosa]|uniref:uncharacterized protein n=1 Tax=Montipora foliosa TaxID=591990 RepID=UPI0035F17050